jgi:hypothetical protein
VLVEPFEQARLNFLESNWHLLRWFDGRWREPEPLSFGNKGTHRLELLHSRIHGVAVSRLLLSLPARHHSCSYQAEILSAEPDKFGLHAPLV